MKSLKMLLAGLTTGLLLFGLISSAVATSYDATTDFSITNGNPNGAWSYGWMDNHTFSMFSLSIRIPGWIMAIDPHGIRPLMEPNL